MSKVDPQCIKPARSAGYPAFALLLAGLLVAAASLLGTRAWSDNVPAALDLLLLAILLAVSVLLPAVLVWFLIRLRKPAYFAAAYGLLLLLIFSTSKQAFVNYYFLIAFALMLSAILLNSSQTRLGNS